MSLPDTFDINSVGTDSHLQFLNWTVDNNGAWDYAADTRGYTYAAVVEYDDTPSPPATPSPSCPPSPTASTSTGTCAAPAARTSSSSGATTSLGRSCIARPQRRRPPPQLRQPRATWASIATPIKPISPAHDHHARHHRTVENFGAVKYGFGLNVEQELTDNLRVFGRFGWNEGQHESFAYTEVDQTVEFGGDYRRQRAGLAPTTSSASPSSPTPSSATTSTISRSAASASSSATASLNYAREDILEGYYTAPRLARSLLRARRPVHRPPRLQPGPRPRPRRIRPHARRLLKLTLSFPKGIRVCHSASS